MGWAELFSLRSAKETRLGDKLRPFLLGLYQSIDLPFRSEVGVACVPGDNFYLGASKSDIALGGRYLRFAFVRSMDLLKEAAELLQRL